MPTYIYLLTDPRTSEVRYVGKSIHPERRLVEHLACKRNNYVTAWVKSLCADGAKPNLLVIEEVAEGDSWEDAERFWIAFFRLAGADLTNLTDGGEGGQRNPPPHVRYRIGAANRGKKLPEELCRRLSEMRRGKKQPPSYSEKLAERNRRAVFTEERRRKIGEAQKGKTLSESHRASISAAQRGRKKTQEMLAAMSQAALERSRVMTERAIAAKDSGMTMKEMVEAGFSMRLVGIVFGVSGYTVKARTS